MKNFSLTIDAMKFDIVLPEDFDDVVESIANAFDFAEQDAEDGIIPFSRRGLLIEKHLTVISNAPEIEMYAEDELKAKLSHLISSAIERKCHVSGVFMFGERELNGRFEADFYFTAISLV